MLSLRECTQNISVKYPQKFLLPTRPAEILDASVKFVNNLQIQRGNMSYPTLKKWRPSDFGGIMLGIYRGFPSNGRFQTGQPGCIFRYLVDERSSGQLLNGFGFLRIGDWTYPPPQTGVPPMAAYQRGLQATYPRDDPPRSSKWSLKKTPRSPALVLLAPGNSSRMLDPSACFNGKMGNKKYGGRCVSLKLLKKHMNVGKEANVLLFCWIFSGSSRPRYSLYQWGVGKPRSWVHLIPPLFSKRPDI